MEALKKYLTKIAILLRQLVAAVQGLVFVIGGDQSDYVSRCYNTADQSIPSATWTKIDINAKLFDPENLIDLTSKKTVIFKSGFYQVNAKVFLKSMTGSMQVAIYKNGTLYTNSKSYTVSNSVSAVISDILYLEKGDYLELYCIQDTTGAISTYGGYNNCYISIAKINRFGGGGNVPMTQNPYKASVNLTTQQDNLTDHTYTLVKLATKEFDPNNDFNITSHKYVVPASGFYQLIGQVFFVGTISNKYFSTQIRSNGVSVATTILHSASGTDGLAVLTSKIVYLNKGDELTLYGRASVGANTVDISSGLLTFLSVHKLSD